MILMTDTALAAPVLWDTGPNANGHYYEAVEAVDEMAALFRLKTNTVFNANVDPVIFLAGLHPGIERRRILPVFFMIDWRLNSAESICRKMVPPLHPDRRVPGEKKYKI